MPNLVTYVSRSFVSCKVVRKGSSNWEGFFNLVCLHNGLYVTLINAHLKGVGDPIFRMPLHRLSQTCPGPTTETVPRNPPLLSSQFGELLIEVYHQILFPRSGVTTHTLTVKGVPSDILYCFNGTAPFHFLHFQPSKPLAISYLMQVRSMVTVTGYLGSGTASHVYRASHSDKEVVVKCIKMGTKIRSSKKARQKERKTLLKLQNTISFLLWYMVSMTM